MGLAVKKYKVCLSSNLQETRGLFSKEGKSVAQTKGKVGVPGGK